MTFWNYMFHWYSGAIWGNMVQWLLVTLPSVLVILWRIEKNHKEHMKKLHSMHKQMEKK